jgi:hypothetical protein
MGTVAAWRWKAFGACAAGPRSRSWFAPYVRVLYLILYFYKKKQITVWRSFNSGRRYFIERAVCRSQCLSARLDDFALSKINLK